MKNKSFATPSAKPVDVQYRLKRLNQTLEDAAMFLFAIDPTVFPEQFDEVKAALKTVRLAVAGLKAPEKKARKTEADKAAAAAAKEAAKAAKAAAREVEKAEKAAAKAATEKPTKKVSKTFAAQQKAAANAELTAQQKSMVDANSAIGRALAAAKARKAAKASVEAVA